MKGGAKIKVKTLGDALFAAEYPRETAHRIYFEFYCSKGYTETDARRFATERLVKEYDIHLKK